MNKSILFSLIFALTVVGLSQIPSVVRAEAEGTIPGAVGSNVPEGTPQVVGSNALEQGTPAATGSNVNETGAIIPSNGGTNANETGAIIPNTNGVNQNETGAIIPNGVGSNGPEGTFTAPEGEEPPVTPPGGGGGGGTPEVIANRTSSGGSSNGGSSVITLITPGITITSCPLLTSYLKLGAANDGAQVTKLQVFLKNVEKLDVNVNGIFDQKTDDAVRAFQIKYLPQILGPWEATRSTGFVYITTLKKINELACASPLTLSADELAIIEAYKNRANGTEQEVGIGQAEGTTPTASSTIEVGSGTSTSANIAAVGEASILSRFWDYIKNLFK
jgi:hypothetical protein